MSDDDDDDDDDDDCAVEFEVVEPFQTTSAIQAFASVLGDGGAVGTPVWLLVDVSLLKSDRLSVDETNLLDRHLVDDDDDEESPLEIHGVNYTAVHLALTPGYHVVAAVDVGSDVTPLLDLFQYIYVPEAGHGHLSPCVVELLCGATAGGGGGPRAPAPDDSAQPPRPRPPPPAVHGDRASTLIDDRSADDAVSPQQRDRSAAAALARMLGADSTAAGIREDAADKHGVD